MTCEKCNRETEAPPTVELQEDIAMSMAQDYCPVCGSEGGD